MLPHAAPPGYPAHLEDVATLGDGRHVSIRPVVPEDLEALREAIEAADEDTLYRRFLTPRPRFSEAALRRLVELDYRDRMALVAIDDTGRGVAIGRYERIGRDAELAIVVDPSWRRVGLGTLLIRRLAAEAAANGFARLNATFLAENQAILGMLRSLGLETVRIEQGIGTAEMALPSENF